MVTVSFLDCNTVVGSKNFACGAGHTRLRRAVTDFLEVGRRKSAPFNHRACHWGGGGVLARGCVSFVRRCFASAPPTPASSLPGCSLPAPSQPAATDAASHLHASAGWPRPLRTLDSAASTACLAPIRRRRGQPLLLATPAPHPPARAASPSLQTSAHRPRPLLALF